MSLRSRKPGKTAQTASPLFGGAGPFALMAANQLCLCAWYRQVINRRKEAQTFMVQRPSPSGFEVVASFALVAAGLVVADETKPPTSTFALNIAKNRIDWLLDVLLGKR